MTPAPPSQVILYLYDSYQLDNDLGTSPQHWRPDMCRSVLAEVCHTENVAEGLLRALVLG